jgi:hypothetical protein
MNRQLLIAGMTMVLVAKLAIEPVSWTDADIYAEEYCGDDSECVEEYLHYFNEAEMEEKADRLKQSRMFSTR